MGRRVLELFSGLGGWRLALAAGDPAARVVAAYDIDLGANATYALNHGMPPRARELATVDAAELAAHGADTWAMSPPCQPFCRLGQGRDLDDRRSQAFLHLLSLFDAAPPAALLLENVEGFLGSRAHALLAERLRRHGFAWRELRLCPTRLGLPNRRPRAWIVAAHQPPAGREPPELPPGPLAPYLDAEEDPALYLPTDLLARHRPGMDLVTSDGCRTACFIGGYGQRLCGSGSFLATERGVRRFSPDEIARLLGLPGTFRFPDELPIARRYRLLGNSLSLPVAAWVAGLLDG